MRRTSRKDSAGLPWTIHWTSDLRRCGYRARQPRHGLPANRRLGRAAGGPRPSAQAPRVDGLALAPVGLDHKRGDAQDVAEVGDARALARLAAVKLDCELERGREALAQDRVRKALAAVAARVVASPCMHCVSRARNLSRPRRAAPDAKGAAHGTGSASRCSSRRSAQTLP